MLRKVEEIRKVKWSAICKLKGEAEREEKKKKTFEEAERMRLENLEPRTKLVIPWKKFLESWYKRLGYVYDSAVNFEDVVPHVAATAVCPHKLSIYLKPLGPLSTQGTKQKSIKQKLSLPKKTLTVSQNKKISKVTKAISKKKGGKEPKKS